MSKKSDARTALIEKRILEEQEWVWTARIASGLSWHAIRGLALRPRDAGGLDRNLPISTLKAMCDAHRAAQGDIVGTREERVERRQLEYDTIAQIARAELMRAADPDQSLIPHLSDKAAKALLEVRAAEAKMHGDDKPAELKAEIVTRDAVDAELEAMLARIPREKTS